MKTIYTIGHSNHTIEVFIAMLQACGVKVLADVRSYPGSGYLPHFNKQHLHSALAAAAIGYIHMPGLGGKKEGVSYIDYMRTNAFGEAIAQLQEMASERPLVYMCAEASWQNCHRRFISQYLYEHSWDVLHIRTAQAVEKHKPIAPKPVQSRLFDT